MRHGGKTARNWIGSLARAAGTPRAFAISLALIAIWAVTGPFLHYSNSWQLAINTRTSILRFFMILFIQHLQTRESAAAHAKLDELIRASTAARFPLTGTCGQDRPAAGTG